MASPDPQHPRRTLSFLQELLGNSPLEMFNTAPNPTENQKVSDFLVALEMMNQGLTDRGQPPVEWGSDPTTSGAGGFRQWAEHNASSPRHTENMMRQKHRGALETVGQMPDFLSALLAPDAATQISENPGGKLTSRAQALLTTQGNRETAPGISAAADPADLLKLRTDQINMAAGAGPNRGSLLDPSTLSPQEAALARQLGGVNELATQYPDVLGRSPATSMPDPSQDMAFAQFLIDAAEREGTAEVERGNPGASRHLLPEAGMDPTAQRIHQGASSGAILPPRSAPYIEGHGTRPETSGARMPAEGIAGANRGILESLLGRIPHDWGASPNELTRPMPTASLPEPGPSRPPLDFIGELMNMLEAQGTQDNPDATMTGRVQSVNENRTLPTRAGSRAGMQAQSNLERAPFPPEGGPPPSPNQLERALGEPMARDFSLPPGGPEFGPDMLEGQPNRPSLGLDEAKNIRVGSSGGQILSGSLLEKILGSAGKTARGLGQGALSAAPNLLDMGSANNFAEALTGANQEFGGVMTPDSVGNMSPIPVNPGMAALYSMVPFLFDRRRFADDPQYRRQMIGPENIPEIA